jgi:hypothetical protein
MKWHCTIFLLPLYQIPNSFSTDATEPIISQSVLFLSDDNKFIEVETELITRLLRPKNKIDQSDLDIFLFEANKAWWLAKGKAITISNIKEFLTKI